LLANFNFWKKCALVQLLDWTRLFMFARLLQVNAVARAIEPDLALLAAALRANAPVNRRTKSPFFAFVADCTSQNSGISGVHYGMRSRK
jgi:hypothetical protein